MTVSKRTCSVVLATALLLGGMLGGAATADELTLDELVARHIEARGGKTVWDSVQSIRVSGDYESFSKVDKFTRINMKDRRFHMEYHLGTRPVVKAHDGEDAWWNNAMRGPGVQRIEGPDLAVLERERDFPNPLFNAAGHELTLVGAAEIDGLDALQIDVKRADGSTESWYLDPDTYLEVARVSPGSDFGRPMPQRTFYDDFRTVDGVVIPHYVESQWYTRNRVQHVESVEINGDIDEAIFKMPPPPGMGPWIQLAGDWQASVEQVSSPGADPVTSERESKVELRLADTVLQESYLSGRDEVLVTLAYDRFHEVYRRTAVDSNRGQIDVQQGKMGEDGTLVLDNLGTGTSFTAGGRTINLRTTYSGLSADGFVVKTEVTTDGGESWFTAATATYSR